MHLHHVFAMSCVPWPCFMTASPIYGLNDYEARHWNAPSRETATGQAKDTMAIYCMAFILNTVT